MLDAWLEGNRTIIDVREQAIRGEHPGNDIIDYIKQSPVGAVIEIHVPHPAQPLVEKLMRLGMTPSIDKVEEEHYCLIVIK